MEELIARVWEDLIGRVGGPLKFRLILQPAVALIVAFLLAFVPYLLIQGPVNRIARYWFPGAPSGGPR